MIKKSIVIFTILLVMSGCSSGFKFISQDGKVYKPRTSQAKINVLYDSPQEPYKVIGIYELVEYIPGWSSPSVNDVIPKLKAEVSRVGGDAFVIRSSYPQNKTISVNGDVIVYK